MLAPSTIEDSDMESLELSENEGETMKEEATGGRKGSPQPCRTTQLRKKWIGVKPMGCGYHVWCRQRVLDLGRSLDVDVPWGITSFRGS